MTDEESHIFKVMLSFTLLGVAIFITTMLDPIRSAFDLWEIVSYYAAALIVGGVAGMLFIWFVNTDGIMVNVSSLSMLLVTVCGFGIVLGSVILYVLLPGNFSVNTLAFGLGLSTTVFAMGL